ncbi:MAG: ATP-binding cassette domain-containing protein [Pseudomonadales bacterium]|nr:ATP-binding cassette domain-containing protein [Pseudomonadales bacterium]MDG1444435.1 ATP-binding cassette domain-containing protein [Pseudomonadales bacterium]
MTSVDLTHISKTYGGDRVLTDISLSLPENQVTALVGESGSGKSTLLQIINGLVKPDSGQIRLGGKLLDYDNLPEIRRNMGYAVQGAGLFPHLTIEQNVTLVASLNGWPQDQQAERYQYLISLLELTDEFSNRYPHSLSGGQQQRVSLCRAMMLNPSLMLLDEPFSALDPITRMTIHEEFSRLSEVEPRTIMLVTHDMSEAIKLAKYIVILKGGEIVQQGEAEDVQSSPEDDYVQKLLKMAGGFR